MFSHIVYKSQLQGHLGFFYSSRHFYNFMFYILGPYSYFKKNYQIYVHMESYYLGVGNKTLHKSPRFKYALNINIPPLPP